GVAVASVLLAFVIRILPAHVALEVGRILEGIGCGLRDGRREGVSGSMLRYTCVYRLGGARALRFLSHRPESSSTPPYVHISQQRARTLAAPSAATIGGSQQPVARSLDQQTPGPSAALI